MNRVRRVVYTRSSTRLPATEKSEAEDEEEEKRERTEIDHGDGARTTVLWINVHARKRHNGTIAICIHYTRSRAFSPLRLPREGLPSLFLSHAFSRYASFSPAISLSSSLPVVSAYTGLYFVLTVFLTEADSGRMTVPRSHWIHAAASRIDSAFIRAAVAGIARSHPVSGVACLRWRETLRFLRKNFALNPRVLLNMERCDFRYLK